MPGAASRLPAPGWSTSTKGKSVTSTSSSRISRGSSLLSSMNTTSRSDAPSSLGSSSTLVSSLGLRRPTTGSGGTTMTSTLYAPTVSSLARMRPPSIVNSSKGRQSHMKGFLSSMAEPPKLPADAHTYAAVSPSLQGPPNKFGFRGTASPTASSASLRAVASRFILPPQFQMTNGIGAVTSPTGRSPGMTLNNGVSPAAAGASKSPVTQPFSFLRADFRDIISPASEAKAAVLDAMENMDTTSREIRVGPQAAKASAPLLPRTPSGSVPHRRPRISRSKVIAKLGEKRAAAAASSGVDRQSDIGVVGETKPTIETPRRPKVRSSLHTRTRRSIAAPGSSGKERAILESYHRGQRKSEAAVRRQSRFKATARISSPARKMGDIV
ncbi:hypothetical protein BS47DRAFT_379874 [Hydnum rufescens UP504]|uniref:Uncharacterized protein n=1 Tax=Hydnum rufescens UP504 TaxID=1448309 RepID=A0A9P6AL51_9AGAM|nr:hypothetical protein BS47DRAFT_379874 [Hydnum rufescens UP504]